MALDRNAAREAYKRLYMMAGYGRQFILSDKDLVTNGYGDDQIFKIITRQELEDQAEEKRIAERWAYGEALWDNLLSTCKHEWKITQGIYKEYKDCTKCLKKWEDVYSEKK